MKLNKKIQQLFEEQHVIIFEHSKDLKIDKGTGIYKRAGVMLAYIWFKHGYEFEERKRYIEGLRSKDKTQLSDNIQKNFWGKMGAK